MGGRKNEHIVIDFNYRCLWAWFTLDVSRTLDEFFELNETVELWYKPVYRLMWRKGITSFTMDNVKLTFYRDRNVYFVGYEKEDS